MTRKSLFLPLAVVTLGTWLIVLAGCDQATKTAGTAIEAGTAAANEQLRQLEDEIKKGTVLVRAKQQLANAQNTQKKIADTISSYRVEVGVFEREIGRLEEAKARSTRAFNTVQEAVKQAGLPKLIDATDEDKAKQIQVSGRTISGREAYEQLQALKKEVGDVDKEIAGKREDMSAAQQDADEMGKQHQTIASQISDYEKQIKEFERLQQRLENAKKIEALGLSKDEVNQALQTAGINIELQGAIDRMGAIIDEKRNKSGGSAPGGTEVNTEIFKTDPQPPITDDDWV